jgi:hypothetical protein
VLENLLDLHEQWRRVFPRATATGGAWVHAPPQTTPGKWTDLVGYLLLFPSLTVVRNTITCNNRKRTTQSILIFCFCFADLLLWFSFFLQLSVFFSFPLLLCFQAVGCVTKGLSEVVLLLHLAGEDGGE